jgi:hypothetical protein
MKLATLASQKSPCCYSTQEKHHALHLLLCAASLLQGLMLLYLSYHPRRYYSCVAALHVLRCCFLQLPCRCWAAGVKHFAGGSAPPCKLARTPHLLLV